MHNNLCPVCGPVAPEISSRYCIDHLRELLARCLDMPARREVPLEASFAQWLEPAAALKPAIAGRRAA